MMDKQDQLFSQLLYLLHHSAMQELGKITNPVNGEVNVNIQQAEQLLEMLKMLKDKTKGNLSNDMSKTQNMMLDELIVNFKEIHNKNLNESTKK
jgi:ribosomal 30S subunit maturation factor RimM